MEFVAWRPTGYRIGEREMELLKPLEEIVSPDSRNASFVSITSNGIEPRSLERMYESISSISISENAPEDVRRHFLQAQHLAIYSWFYYPFHTTADFISIVAIEFALKAKAGETRGGLARLLRRAVNEGWIHDEGFSIARPRRHGEKSYVEGMIEWLPQIRNDYGHGSSTMLTGSYGGIKFAAEFINQLFP